MTDILNQLNEWPLIPIISALIGLCIFLLPFFPSPAGKKLAATGLKAEGIIFRIESDMRFNAHTGRSSQIVTVRFVTEKKEWITGESKNDAVVSYTGQYKEGEKVTVIYDPDNPSNFFLETKQFLKHSKLFFSLAGLATMLISVYYILSER